MDASSQPTRADPYGPPCPGCARPRTETDAHSVLWSTLHGSDGRVRFLCPACTREQLPEIEAGLPSRPSAAASGHRPAA